MTLQGEEKRWYAFKVFYNKVFEIDKDIRGEGVETYFPKVRAYKLQEEKQKETMKPAISSLIFVHRRAGLGSAEDLLRQGDALQPQDRRESHSLPGR